MNKKLIIGIIVIIFLGFMIFILLNNFRVSPPNYVFSNDWLDKRNIYVFGTPPVEYLKLVNATGVSFSVYYGGLNSYDKEYLRELHQNGFKVSSNFPTIQSHITKNTTLIEIAKCVDIEGNPLGFFGEQYSMCSENKEWKEFLKNRIKEHVDGEADAIQIDEIGVNYDCFCEDSMKKFREYLANRYSTKELHDIFGIDDINSFDYRIYLLNNGAKNIWSDPNQNLLNEYFNFKYQDRVSFIKELIQYAREYANRDILFSGNTYGFRPDQQIFIPYLDFLVFEMPIGSLPGGKLCTIYFLGEAISSKPIVGFPDIFDLAKISEEDWWLWRHWLAEAYACGGSFLLPYNSYAFGEGSYSVPFEKLSDYTNFITSHRDYYVNNSRIARVAILFDLNSTLINQAKWRAWEAWNSFLKVGYALQESHILFDVIYNGDGKFINKTANLDDLRKYSIVIIPAYYDLGSEAEGLLNVYHQNGGLVLRLKEDMNVSELPRIIKNTNIELGLRTNASDDISIVAYKRGDSIMLHFINYDYNNVTHKFIPKQLIEVEVSIPDGVNLSGKKLKLLTPDANEKIIEYNIQENKVKFVIPEVYEYMIVLFG
jgi:hypothetical protein